MAQGSVLRATATACVLLNNNGGAIFDMLPQKSDEFSA